MLSWDLHPRALPARTAASLSLAFLCVSLLTALSSSLHATERSLGVCILLKATEGNRKHRACAWESEGFVGGTRDRPQAGPQTFPCDCGTSQTRHAAAELGSAPAPGRTL